MDFILKMHKCKSKSCSSSWNGGKIFLHYRWRYKNRKQKI